MEDMRQGSIVEVSGIGDEADKLGLGHDGLRIKILILE
jgi:hypothetical protein